MIGIIAKCQYDTLGHVRTRLDMTGTETRQHMLKREYRTRICLTSEPFNYRL